MRAPGSFLFAAAVLVLVPGARLHVEPDPSSLSIAVVDEEVEVTPIEVRDGWALVQYLDCRGWVRPGPPIPLARREGSPTLRDREAPAEVLASGRELMTGGGRELPLKRWRVFTDVEDDALLEWLSQTTQEVPGQVRRAWKLVSAANPKSAVLFFADAARARSFDTRACGRVGTFFVSVAPVRGDPTATRRTFLHQVGHLYALDVLGNPAPPWLEEGLADAFAAIGELGPNFEKPLPRAAAGPDDGLPGPPSMSELFRSGPELFADDARGAVLRYEARRLVRYFWNGGSTRRLYRFRQFVLGNGVERPSFDVERFLNVTRMTVPELQRRVRSFREYPGGSRSLLPE